MPASIGVNMRVTGHHSQGGRKYMEDKFSVAYQQTEDENDLEYAYFGIFDGHGGSEAAAFAKEHLMDSIVKQKLFWSENDDDVLRAIRNGYMLTHMNMWKELDRWPKTTTGLPSTAGTTASVAFIRRGKIYIGHVGDSAIVLGYQVKGQDDWCARPLTLDHKPETPAEMSRIHSSGGKVVVKAGVPRVVWNRPAPGPAGPRCDEIPFLAVARSLGDLWSYNVHSDEFVVSPDPDVGVLSIDPAKFRCLIFGTDGLWNMVTPDAAVQLVQAAERHNESAPPEAPPPDAWLNPSKILVDSALQRWSSTKMRADNTSVVTLMMDPPGPPRNRAPHPPEPAPPVTAPSPAVERPSEPYTAASPCTPTPDGSGTNETEAEAETVAAGSVPSRGLSIVTRFPDPRPPPPPLASPPHPLDRVHSVGDSEPIISNYGNPADSYFIARLLNKSQVRNTLHDVFEEIARAPIVQLDDNDSHRVDNNNFEDEIPKIGIARGPPAVSPVAESRYDIEDGNSSLPIEEGIEEVEKPTVTEEPEKSLDATAEPLESIQINEVSSSSPVDAPDKNKKRRTKGGGRGAVVPQLPARSLRSRDTLLVSPARPAPGRPHTRLANKADLPSKGKGDSRVPVPVHVSKPPQPEKVVILNRPKVVLSPAVVRPPQPIRSEEPKIAKIQKNSSIENKKGNEKSEGIKTRLTAIRSAPEIAKPGNGRVTRSKDIQPSVADVPLEAVRDVVDDHQKRQSLPEAQVAVVPPPQVILTRHRVTVLPRASSPQRAGGTFLRARGRERALDNTESSKENVLTLPGDVGGAAKTSKRRNSGGVLDDLEPKEKRRTRLDDKRGPKPERVEEQHQDVSSTQQFKDGFLLGLRISANDIECPPESLASRRSLKNVNETAESRSPLNSKTRNGKKTAKLNVIVDDGVSGEVHSTTVNLDVDPMSAKIMPTSRGLRPRQDLPRKRIDDTSDKRALRSTDCITDKIGADVVLEVKESRPILRSRNSVGAPASKVTPRRRAPWPLTPRSLRKRLTK